MNIINNIIIINILNKNFIITNRILLLLLSGTFLTILF